MLSFDGFSTFQSNEAKIFHLCNVGSKHDTHTQIHTYTHTQTRARARAHTHTHTRIIKQTNEPFVMCCAIWYHFHNLKNMKNNHGGVLLLVKVTVLQGCFSPFLNYMDSIKLRQASHLDTFKKLLKHFMAPFYGRVQLNQVYYSHFEEAVYFLPFSSQKFLVVILSTSEE